MNIRSWVFLLAFLLTAVLWPNQQLTASTYYTPPVCEAFNLAKAVFIGRVVTASQKREYVYDDETDEPSVSCSLDVVFEVIERFSGTPERTMNVWESGGDTCERVDFTLGEVHLVYAYEEEDKKLWAGLRTRSLKPYSINSSDDQWNKRYQRELQKEYDEELEFLRSASRKTLSGARIYGVARSSKTVLGKNDKGRYEDTLAGVTIKIESERRSIEVETDSDGKFDVQGLEPGNYKITTLSLEGYVPLRIFKWRDDSKIWNKELSLRECGCAQLGFMFDVSPTTQVDGRVFDAEGKPLAGVEISLISEKWREEKDIKDDDIRSYQTRSGKTDAEGKYKIEKVDPGRYLLGVNLIRPTPESPYPRLFYPDVSDIKQAEVITVYPEKTTGPFDIRLTQTMEKRTIQGIVVWPDNMPVAGANISLRPPGERLRRGYEATTDEQGRFTLEGLRDYEYELQVYWRNKDKKASDAVNESPLGLTSAISEVEKLKVADNIKDLKIVLSKQL